MRDAKGRLAALEKKDEARMAAASERILGLIRRLRGDPAARAAIAAGIPTERRDRLQAIVEALKGRKAEHESRNRGDRKQ